MADRIYYDPSETGKRIRQARLEAGIKQIDLAREMNISPDMLANIEKGKNTCAPDYLMFLCQKFNKSADYFYFGAQDIGCAEMGRADLLSEINRILRKQSKEKLYELYRIIKIIT